MFQASKTENAELKQRKSTVNVSCTKSNSKSSSPCDGQQKTPCPRCGAKRKLQRLLNGIHIAGGERDGKKWQKSERERENRNRTVRISRASRGKASKESARGDKGELQERHGSRSSQYAWLIRAAKLFHFFCLPFYAPTSRKLV